MIKVKKRNGSIVDFNKDKIVSAVNKALKAAKIEDSKIAKDVAISIYESIDKEQVSIDEIHGMVETELMEKGFSDAARSYILYRYKKKEKFIKERQEKRKLLNIEGQLDPVSEKFSLNSLRVLESRYLIKDENLKVIETPTALFERIATHVGCANIMYDEKVFDREAKHEPNTGTISGLLTWNNDYYIRTPEEYEKSDLHIGKYRLNGYNLKQLEQLYGKLSNENKMKVSFDEVLRMVAEGEFDKYEKTIKSYFDLMVSQKFMPNTPTIANAGNKLGQLSACFVIDMNDNIESIMDTAKDMAIIFKSGGGVGINYAKLREEGATISTTSGTSSGPLSFMNIINTVTDTVKQGGKRRGANMGSMNSSHPDILKFIHAKETPGILENFNVSVGIDGKFWECYKENKPYELISPSSGKVKATVNPRDFMKEISRSAWNSSEPGVLLFDNANKYNVMKGLKGELNSTNPCGEQYLYPYESCIAKNTRILTKDGYKFIQDIKPGEEIAINKNGYASFSTVNTIINNGIKNIYEITTHEGYTVKATNNHKFLTKSGEWVRLDELAEETELTISAKEPYCSIQTNTDNYKEDEMIGWIHGDGWFTDKVVGISFNGKDGDFDVKRRLLPVFHKVFKTEHIRPMYDSPDNFQLQTESSGAKQILVGLGVKFGRAGQRRIPDYIWETDSVRQIAFLRGLFSADGSIQNRSNTAVQLASTSKEFLLDVQLLLLRFGLHSTIYTTEFKTTKRNPQHKLALTQENARRFMDSIGFLSERKNSMFNRNPPKYYNSDKKTVRIKSIVECGKEEVYDIEVANEHQFIANGFVVHNCNLGSINLTKFVKNKLFDFDSFGQVIDICVDFLDSVIDVNKYPVNEIDKESWKTRRIGLGVMGLGDLLFMLEIPYNSVESYALQEQIAQFLSYRSISRSIKLAKLRGSFPYFEQTECKHGKVDIAGVWEGGITSKAPVADWQEVKDDIQKYGLRNVNVDMVAPTGSISMIADCSSGIEPVFALAFEKKVAVGNFYYVNPYLELYLKKHNIFYDEELLKTISKSGSCQNVDLPEEVKRIFVTSMDIHGLDHVVAQAVWQRWMTNAVSKTCNLPNNVTPEDIENIYLFAHEMGLKGITIYRDGSRNTQVLYTENMENKQLNATEYSRNLYQQKMIKGLDGMIMKAQMINKEVTPTVEEFFTQNKEFNPNNHSEYGESELEPLPRYKTSNIADCPKCGKRMVKFDGCKKCPDPSCGESLC
jgi:ribonucleoside-diphosphate reductase alpha chain